MLNNENFIKISKNIHGDKYDYSITEYVYSLSKVKIICPIHGIFEMRASHHMNGHGCKKCSDEKIKYNTLTTEDFIEKSIKIHGDKYDYSLSQYDKTHKNIKIICKNHGMFEQLPSNHLKGLGCSKCSNIRKLTLEEFVENSKKVHGNKYDYSVVEYKNYSTNVIIICPTHGKFKQSPSAHIHNKSGCPRCKSSRGENEIKNILEKYEINHFRQFKFDDCKDKLKLPFDFYLPDHNICIEFDGKQHSKPIKRFGGADNFEITKKHDEIKNIYCDKNEINLFRIKHDDNIDEKIKIILNENQI